MILIKIKQKFKNQNGTDKEWLKVRKYYLFQ